MSTGRRHPFLVEDSIGAFMPVDDIDLAPDLTLTVGAEAARLTPAAGFRLAERLIRLSTRRLIEIEAEIAADAAERDPLPTRRSARRSCGAAIAA
jgi:hypothetical protein